MTPNENYTKTSKTINLFNDRFMADIPKAQNSMWGVIQKTIKKFDVSETGEILTNTKNLKIMRTLRDDIKAILITPQYKKDLKQYLGSFDELKGINDTYHQSIVSSQLNANKFVYKEVLNYSAEATKNSLLDAGISANIIDPIETVLTQNVTSGASYNDLVESLRTQILGSPEKLGKLESYASQITTDSLNQFNANYNKAVSNDLGFEFYYYAGSLKDTSRTYCINQINNGRYYHQKEVENSASASWSGKIPNTNSTTIFVNRGGYRCRHQYLAVNTDRVPKDVIERAINKGYYEKPT